MGGIRKPKKKYLAPGHPWQKTRLAEELIYVGEYGLRNKRELWRHRTNLTQFRGTARDLVALAEDERGVQEPQLLKRLNRLALIDDNSQLDDVLNLTIRDILERRLQTQVLRQGLAKSMHHARQLITHGHITLDGHRVTSPGMLLHRDAEKRLEYTHDSPYRQHNHPELPKGEAFAPTPEVPKEKPEKVEVKIAKIRDIKEITLVEEEPDPDELDETANEVETPESKAEKKPAAKKPSGASKKETT
ncbi:MAG: 30S ribosomal protein S4 [Candidatus Hermodarchaeota archaeon]|nr:30S ribosomal protein S4 [Candidatus Hermodarchaeota archaeon]